VDAAAGRYDDTDDLRHGVVRAMMWTALVLIMTTRMMSARQNGLPWSAAFAAMIPYPPLVALLALPRRLRARGAAVPMLVAAILALYAVPFALCGAHWAWLPWPLAVAALCAFPGRIGWPLFGLVLIGDFAGVLWSGRGFVAALDQTAKTANDGMILFGLYALGAMVTSLHAARGQLAAARLDSERRRLDGALHACVGARLRALGAELQRAADETDTQAAHDRIGAAVATARRLLAEIRAAAGDLRAAGVPCAAVPRDPDPIESPRVARQVLAGVFFCDAALQVNATLADHGETRWKLLLVPLICAAGAMILPPRPTRGRLVLYALIVGPAAQPGGYLVPDLSDLGNLWPFLAGFVLVRMRRPLSWVVVGAILAGYYSLYYFPPPVPDLYTRFAGVVSFFILTWLTFSLLRLSELIGILDRAQEDLAAQAVIRERLRVSRDLHDRLSFCISAIALKGELGQRMLVCDPEGARGHLALLPGLAADALRELESLTGSPVGLSFAQELASACELLSSAGVEPVVTTGNGPVPPETDSSMAVILREAVTNVLRHSSARMCSITVTHAAAEGVVRLTVVNDGLLPRGGAAAPVPDRSGSGLVGLAERTGGRLTAHRRPDERFEVVAEFATDPDKGSDTVPDTVPAAI
jgi:signal transduction histidine kinase